MRIKLLYCVFDGVLRGWVRCRVAFNISTCWFGVPIRGCLIAFPPVLDLRSAGLSNFGGLPGGRVLEVFSLRPLITNPG